MAFACDEVAGFECKRVPAHDAVAVLASERSLHTRHALVRNPLHEADVKLDLVPLDDSALDLEKRQTNGRLPVLGRL